MVKKSITFFRQIAVTSVICGFLLFLSACLGEEPEAQDFFQVTTLPLRTDQGDFGTLLLSGNIEALGASSVVADHGFYFSTDLLLIGCDRNESTSLESLGPRVGGGSFSQSITDLVDGEWYYFQAFARVGERLVCGQVDSFRLGLNLLLTQIDPLRRNDSISYRLEATSNTPLTEFALGYHLLIENGTNFDTLRANISLGDDEVSEFTVHFPLFNSRYRLVPFLNGSRSYVGEPLEVLVTDGWRKIPDFPKALTESVTLPFDNDIFVFGGCTTPNCVSLNSPSASVYRLSDAINTEPESWSWDDISDQFQSDIPKNINQGIGFTSSDSIYMGFGYVPPSNGTGYNGLRKIEAATLNGTNVSSNIGSMINGLSFVENGYVYFGLGSTSNNSIIRDFYRRSLVLNLAFIPEDTLVSPPYRVNNSDQQIGR